MHIFVKDINEVIKKEIIKYDRGRIIVDKDMLTEDALILTIEENQLVLQDNLKNYQINTNDFFISRKLKPYYEDEYPNFKKELTYIDMQKIIVILEKYAAKKQFQFIVSQTLLDYIDQHAYWIEERSKYALLIKNHDSR